MTISLDKRTQEAEASLISLLKTQQDKGIELGDLVAQVEMAIDFSGSMNRRYADGEVQQAVERALALSLSGLDDDGVVPVHFFDNRDYPVELVDQNNYVGFVDAWAAKHTMGGTNYSATISNILGGAKKKLFGKSPDTTQEKSDPPKLVLFITDGEPNQSDKPEIERLLVGARTRPIFWQFIMLGSDASAARYLDHLNNNLTGPGVDNIGVTQFEHTRTMPDKEFFDDIISEFFPTWLPAARQAGITTR